VVPNPKVYGDLAL